VQRRTDREVLALANHVRHHRRSTNARRSNILLALGRAGHHAPLPLVPGFTVVERAVPMPEVGQPALEARLRCVPRAFWPAVGQGAVSDAVRDALREIDHDVVLFLDPWVLAAAPSDALDGAAVLQLDAAGGGRFLRAQGARVQRVIGSGEAADGAALARLCNELI
jgi:hypothetical protein